MAATPETLRPEVPQVTERQEEFVVPETLQQSGVKVIQKNFKAQVNDDNGKPIVSTPPSQVITTVSPPADQPTLISWTKGKKEDSKTWAGAFWLRILKKAFHFGWKVVKNVTGSAPQKA